MMSTSEDESYQPEGDEDVDEDDENISDDDEMQECEEVAQVTFREGGDDFSPKIESEVSQRRMLQSRKTSNLPQTFCSVPGCGCNYLLQLGAKLTSFQIPLPNSPGFSKVWKKWIEALGCLEESAKNVEKSSKICELHFSESCFVSLGSITLGRRKEKRLKPNSYPTLNIPVPEEEFDHPSSKFRTNPSFGATVKTGSRRVEITPGSPDSVRRNKTDYKKRVEQVLLETGINGPPSILGDLLSKLGVESDSEDVHQVEVTPESKLPPCTILKPVAKDGEAPLPAIVLPGIDHCKAVELLKNKNIQAMLKKLADKHRDEMIKKMSTEGDEEEVEERDEHGSLMLVRRKKQIPPPPAIILQATELCPDESPDPMVPDVVQRAIDKTFKEQEIARKSLITRQQVQRQLLLTQRRPTRLNHEDFLESLPPIESKYVLDEDGNVIPAPTGDHDYGQSSRNSGISIFDPAGLRQEIERWRLKVESMRQNNFDLAIRLEDAKFSRSSGTKGSPTDRKRLEKLEVANQKMGEELVRLKLERRRMLGKERNRRRKRQKVLERRQKRRDWIMQQIELGNMTKEHLELVYSRKKLPYEKKANQPNNLTVYPMSIPSGETQPITVTVQHPMISNTSVVPGHVSGTIVPKKRSRPARKVDEENESFGDLSGVTSVVVTDMQHSELNDDNLVAVAGVPGVVITGRLHGTHQIIVEGGSDEYTPEQIDMIVKAVDDLEVNSWRIASSP